MFRTWTENGSSHIGLFYEIVIICIIKYVFFLIKIQIKHFQRFITKRINGRRLSRHRKSHQIQGAQSEQKPAAQNPRLPWSFLLDKAAAHPQSDRGD